MVAQDSVLSRLDLELAELRVDIKGFKAELRSATSDNDRHMILGVLDKPFGSKLLLEQERQHTRRRKPLSAQLCYY
jgi:hypothetical protein